MGGGGLPPRMQQFLARLDRLSREQYLDFARVRRFRQSIVCRADRAARVAITPERLAGLHMSASTTMMQNRRTDPAPAAAADDDQAFLDWLAQRYPASTPASEAAAWFARRRAADATTTMKRLAQACFSGAIELHRDALPLVLAAGERPLVTPVARWQATQDDAAVTNLRHEGVRFDNPLPRHLLTLMDGTRDRSELADAMRERLLAAAEEPGRFIEHYLERFATAALMAA
jgi:hypothetical protein